MGPGEERDCRELCFEQVMLDVEQETQMKEVVELSLFEMKNTAAELEKRLNNIEDEDNEWKTRYETQIELNRQLERQIGLLRGKMQHVCGNPIGKLTSVRSFDQMHLDSLNQFLKQLEEEKNSLQSQLKDYALRLEQEVKAYHKVNDERRAYFAVISQISRSLKSSERQKMDTVQIKREDQIQRGRYNIPKNRRILDPKKGPIKKTAGVKYLPKLKV
ncbi:coiled-coil domain-containing protein 169 [Eublepharis macularius]|uniref:Coiled-coil domain-containing protein 169 n=1 Tax=Eublepharis macularius TaxID=481883 RepID=A0AA97J2W5_EUBMA|nr:coiled-coil domain-containing protein 169 [Eublepharis macularius]